MFFFIPIIPLSKILIIYILVAIVPAIFLLRYIYKQDTIEKEPPSLLWSLILCGVAAALCSIVLEGIGSMVLDSTVSQDSPYYVIILSFIVVAVVEEGTKLFFLKRRTWKDWNFNYLFDGVVYSAFVSLGFAAFENIKYIFSYGISVALPRALLAIPGHLGFSVFMGIFYGRAKLCEKRGRKFGTVFNLFIGYFSAVFLHGFYDACAMIGTTKANIVFYAFVGIMYIIVYRLIKSASYKDRPLY